MIRFLVPLLWLAFCAPAHAVFVKVQFVNNAAFSGTTVSATLPSAVTAGNLIIASFNLNTNVLPTSFTISDGVNTYTTGASVNAACTGIQGSNNRFSFAFAPNVAAGSTTVTITIVGATFTFGSIWLEEWSGVATSNPIDGCRATNTAGSGNPGDVITSGTFSTTVNGDMIWGWGQSLQGGGQSLGAGFAFGTNDLGTSSWASEFLTQSTAGSTQANWTATTGCFECVGVGAGFKAAGGGGPTVSTRRSLTGVGP